MRKKAGGMKKGFKYTKRKYWYTNNVVEKQIFVGDPIPEGFKRGRLKRNRPAWNSGLTKNNCDSLKKMSETKKANLKERLWINNHVEEHLVDKNLKLLPEGYKFGKLTSYLKESWASTDAMEEDFKNFYASHSLVECYKKFHFSKNQLINLIEKYNLENIDVHKARFRKICYTDEWRKRHSEKLKGKNIWSKGRKHSKEQIEKFKISHSKRTSEDIKNSKLKEYNTRKQNGTYLKHMTKDEALVKNILLKHFNETDIVYLYFDSIRYPFECNFYIKSKELFIEVNIYPSHGGKPFNMNDANDVRKLNEWKYKSEVENKKQYTNWIYTWTDLDIRKQKIAKENNLNYISLYKIDELEDKLNEYM